MNRLSRPGKIALAASTALLLSIGGLAQAVPPDENPATGWQTYTGITRLPELSTGTQSHQFSSFDREGGNDHDGFSGKYSCLRTTDEGCVLAEATGAGEIQSIWSTWDRGDVTKAGNIIIELDGTVVLNAPFQDVVEGKAGAPFIYPFVADKMQTSGGVYIKVPMPYRESMRVTVQNNPFFYHVSYRSFATADGISTFDPSNVPTDLFEQTKTWGTQPPASLVNEPNLHADFSLAPGESTTIATLDEPGMVQAFTLGLPGLKGAPAPERMNDDGRATKDSTSFTVAIDPANEGVTLTRRYDPISPDQKARILVDGTQAGQWDGTEGKSGVWREESVELPADATAGKSSIRITNEFISAGNDFNEFRYFVDSKVGGDMIRTDEVDVGEGTDESRASEQAHDYSIMNERWHGDRTYARENTNPADAEQIAASDDFLTNTHIQIHADGQLTVDAPIGEFFGTGLGQAPVTSLMFGVDPETGTYSSWWPMPFGKTMTISLVNNSQYTLNNGTCDVTFNADASVAERLSGPVPSLGYFYATHHAGPTEDGRDWVFLSTEGQGRFMGVSHTMSSSQGDGNVRGYLEGDERIYVDGLRTPQWHGTGSEDFYEGGWYFDYGPFSAFTNGAPLEKIAGTYGCDYQCDSAYRLLIGDAIDFQSSISAGLEHGPDNRHPAEYSSTAFWYGHADAPVLTLTDSLNITDVDSEAAHAYSGGGEPRSLTSTFEGNDDTVSVTDSLRDSADPITFTAAVKKSNQGVRLHRMSDQSSGYQSVDVAVNGTHVGTWLQPLANQTHQWLEDTFEIPRAITENVDSITVELTPRDGSAPWSAARYEVYTIGGEEAATPVEPPEPAEPPAPPTSPTTGERPQADKPPRLSATGSSAPILALTALGALGAGACALSVRRRH